MVHTKPQRHKLLDTNSVEDVQEESQSQNIAYQWHQDEEQTNHDRQYKPKKSKTNRFLFPEKVILMLDKIH